ncbi:hypothetical protein AB0I94_02260 [Streptomyces sp. NPDC050147]|uniref:hypothetical protein n=1 Tax=Streptomyces sp. NPDC050147 TaxID=3155513 RepID=UPI003447C0FD
MSGPRKTADTITDDDLDALYARLETEAKASRRLLAQRQEMAEERYAWQQRGDRAEAVIERVRVLAASWQDAMRSGEPHPAATALLATLDEQPGPAATEATEPEGAPCSAVPSCDGECCQPVGFAAIDAVIRLEGPKITVADDEITIEGLRIEKPARLTVHAGRRRLTLMHNAFYDFSAINACRDETCTCHTASEPEKTTRVIALYEQWVKAGGPPLGVSMSRWWDARLVELHEAILPPTGQTKAQP